MIEALAIELTQPPAIVIEAKRRKKRSNSRRSLSRSAYYVGAIIILTGDDGEPYKCQLTHQDPTGQWWCVPLTSP